MSIFRYSLVSIVYACCLTGCATVIQSQRVLDNVGLTYIAVEPTKTVYIDHDRGFVEFTVSHYTDHMPLNGEDIHTRCLTRDPKSQSRLVYLEMITPNITGEGVFDTLISNKESLLDPSRVPFAMTTPIPFPNALNTFKDDGERHFQFEGYPVVLDKQRGATWYVVAPLQIPAFVLDCGLTFVLIPVGLVHMVFD